MTQRNAFTPTVAAGGIVYLVGYVLLDYVSFVQAYRGFGITPWNPGAGLTVALAYLRGGSLAPFALLAPMAADFAVRSWRLPLMFEIAGSFLIGGVYLLAGIGLGRLPHFDPRFGSVRDVLRLAAVALVSAASVAAGYVVVLWAAGFLTSDELLPAAWRSLVGDLIGVLVVAPLLLVGATQRPAPRLRAEHALQLAAIVFGLTIIFGYRNATTFQLFYLLFLPVLWIALRHSVPGVVVAIAIVQIGLLIGSYVRFGSNPGLTALQALMVALALTGLVVGAMVSEQRIAARRLREQQDAIQRALRLRSSGEIAAAIAHEVNQPITALGAYSSVIEAACGKGDLDLAREAAGKLKAQAERAAAIIAAIRDLSKDRAAVREPVDVAELLRGAVRINEDDAAGKAISLTVVTAPGLPLLDADPVQLTQAVHNLIVNGIAAINDHAEQGRIEVSAHRAETDEVVIAVADTGPGFPPGSDLASDAPLMSTRPGGTGLGLAIVRSIAEAHGGALELRSTPRGAVVELRLPVTGE